MKHPYAEILEAIASGRSVEFWETCSGWVAVDPEDVLKVVSLKSFSPNCFRVKRETVNINGSEVPRAQIKPLQKGQLFWVVDLSGIAQQTWSNTHYHREWLAEGRIQLTAEDATAHRLALLSFMKPSQEI